MSDTATAAGTSDGDAMWIELDRQAAELCADLPPLVPRAEVEWLLKCFGSATTLKHLDDAMAADGRAEAACMEASAAVRQMLAILKRTEDESFRIRHVLFREFRIDVDPAFAALHRAIAEAMEIRH